MEDGPRIEISERLIRRLLGPEGGAEPGRAPSRRRGPRPQPKETRARPRETRAEAEDKAAPSGEISGLPLGGPLPLPLPALGLGLVGPTAAAPVPGPGPDSSSSSSAVEAVQQRQHAAALAEIRAVTDEVARVKESVLGENAARMDKVKEMASALHAKQFRPPSKPPLCLEERKACAACYREHTTNPLPCADAVRTFVQCARMAEEAFVAAKK